MTTAAQKVFGITELLEQILLDLPWRKLFVLRRVNRAFSATMRGSMHLRRRMLLDYEAQPQTPNSVFGNHAVMELNVSAFEFNNSDITENDAGLSFKFALNLPLSKEHGLKSLGISSTSVSGRVAARGSWRSIKLSHTPVAVHITVEIRAPAPQPSYEESITLEPGKGTFGRLHNHLDGIRKRDSWEHMWRGKLFAKNHG